MNPYNDLIEWITALGVKHQELGGFAICPFIRRVPESRFIPFTDRVIPPDHINFDIIIYHVPDEFSEQRMEEICNDYNRAYPHLIFLADHKDRNTKINGIQSNNGKHNFILCQPKERLRAARKALSKTNYYKYWENDYLKEVLGDDIDIIP